MKTKFMLFAVLLAFASCAFMQNRTLGDKKYIPKDLDECFVQLEMLLEPDDIAEIRGGAEEDMINYHLGLGMWIRNNWGLWGGSRLAKWFNAKGVTHPDEMSGLILVSFWRHLNQEPIEIDEQIRRSRDSMKEMEAIQQSTDLGK
jgi:hypothetical protein